jgi:uncharacterized membrane protein
MTEELQQPPLARPQPSKAQIAGHPIHPSLIPLPIGLLTAAAASDVMARRGNDEFWPRASRYLLGAGLATGAAAGVVGAIDYFGLSRPRQVPEGRWHARGNVVAMALTAGNLALRSNRNDVPPSGLALSMAVAGILGVTGALGGELSYRHLVGVEPKARYEAQPQAIGTSS